MNGIEVLDTVKVVTEYSLQWGWMIGISLVVFVLSGIGIYFLVTKYDSYDSKIKNIIFSILMGLLLGGAFCIITGAIAKEPIAYENQYKVTISDEVNFNEFNERYEIIDQEGKIYTVREK